MRSGQRAGARLRRSVPIAAHPCAQPMLSAAIFAERCSAYPAYHCMRESTPKPLSPIRPAATLRKRQHRRTKGETVKSSAVDEGRKRVIGIMASILASLHMQTADNLFGCPQGSPRTDKLIEASIQWAERIMQRIDERGT